MLIHAYGSRPHFVDHLRAIHRHLPDAMRGGIAQTRWDVERQSFDDAVVMVAAYDDLALFDGPVIYVEHGAGQRYAEYVNPAAANHYHGGRLPPNVIGVVGPRSDVANSWGVPGFAAGAPICDPYELFGEDRVVAITFHWNAAKVCPEATNALDHYAWAFDRLIPMWRRQGIEILGHAHPKFEARMANVWKHYRVPMVTADEVRRRASVLIADNTSLMYEMAYLMRDVVALNAPWFRRDVEHGLRFWSHVPGVQVDDADQLTDLDLTALGSWRADPTAYAYGSPFSTGSDGFHAAAWVAQLAASI